MTTFCKRRLGQFYTQQSPFEFIAARRWLEELTTTGLPVIEPFCGIGSLVKMLPRLNWAGFYDIDPCPNFDLNIEQRDSLSNFPDTTAKGDAVGCVITNPPWLSRRSASRQGIKSNTSSKYDDIYKDALEECLKHAKYVAAIIPESFLSAGILLSRLRAVVIIPFDIFGDSTEQPACLALFDPQPTAKIEVWCGNNYFGDLKKLRSHKLLTITRKEMVKVKFGREDGEIVLFAMDSRKRKSIRFEMACGLSARTFAKRSRYVVKIKLPMALSPDQLKGVVDAANAYLAEFREATKDVTLTASRSRMHGGRSRKRLDFKTAAKLLTVSINEVIGLASI